MMIEQRRRAITHEKIDRRFGEGPSKIREQRRREYDVAESAELGDEDAARSRDARWLHSAGALLVGGHSFAYCTKA